MVALSDRSADVHRHQCPGVREPSRCTILQQASAALARLEDEGDTLCVSRQVLREYVAVLTRAHAGVEPVAAAVVAAAIRRMLEVYAVLEDGPAVTEQLLDLIEGVRTGGKQVYDANLVATMLVHDVTRLLPINAADFRRFGSHIELVAP